MRTTICAIAVTLGVLAGSLHDHAIAQTPATAPASGGPITALTPEEGTKADKVNEQIVGRAWELWKQRVRGK